MDSVKAFIFGFKFTTALKKVFIFSCVIGVYSIIPSLDHFDFKYFNLSFLNINLANLETVFGIIIGLILIFRANRSYERWWEARTLWGNLVSSSRNLAIKIKAIAKLDQDQCTITSSFIINFAHALKNQLRNNANATATCNHQKIS